MYQLCNLFNQSCLVDGIRNLGHDNPLPVLLPVLNLCSRAHAQLAAAGMIGGTDAADAHNLRAGREVRAGDMLHQFVNRNFRVIDQSNDAVNDLTQVMRRNVGSHADRNTVGAVYQKMRKPGRQYHRLFSALVKVWHKVYGIFFNIGQHMHGQLGHLCLGITVGSRAVTVNRTKVTVTVHSRITHREILRHTNQCVIDRRVAVRMVSTQHITDGRRTLFIRLVRRDAVLVHCVQNAAVYRL